MYRLIAFVFCSTLFLFSQFAAQAQGCHQLFCSNQLTLSEEFSICEMVVACKLVHRSESVQGDNPTEGYVCTFEVTQVLKGEKHLERLGSKPNKVKAFYFGNAPLGSTFAAFSLESDGMNWRAHKADERMIIYVSQLPKLAKLGADRLAFFQDYFEDKNKRLADDAYAEFAEVTYAELVALKGRMHREKLIGWIKDKRINADRRRLYLSMLGICGKAEDVPLLEELMTNKRTEVGLALDAAIACYLSLKGADGLPKVEELFLKNQQADYICTHLAIQALRFVGDETSNIPRDRVIAAMRHLLDRPKICDLIIPDLARWEDWSAMQKVVEIFKKSDEKWIRVSVIRYLMVCPLAEAKTKLDELAKIDPEAFRAASEKIDISR